MISFIAFKACVLLYEYNKNIVFENTIENILQMQQKAHREHRPPPLLIWGMWNSPVRCETVNPKVFENVLCSMPDLSRKFHENPHTSLSVILLKDKQTDKATAMET